MTPVSLFTVALGAFAFAVGAATLLAPLLTRRGASALDRTTPEGRPPTGPVDGSSRPFDVDGDAMGDDVLGGDAMDGGEADRETFVRGFTLTVLGLVCLLWGVLGL